MTSKSGQLGQMFADWFIAELDVFLPLRKPSGLLRTGAERTLLVCLMADLLCTACVSENL